MPRIEWDEISKKERREAVEKYKRLRQVLDEFEDTLAQPVVGLAIINFGCTCIIPTEEVKKIVDRDMLDMEEYHDL